MKQRKFFVEVNKMTLDDGFEKFINLKTALNRADDTLKYYSQRFEKFCIFLEKEKNIKFTCDLDEDIINDYILYRRKTNPAVSSSTINNNLRAIRAVLYFFMDRGFTENFSISLLTVKRNPKEAYTQDEQELLIKKPDLKKCSFPEYRNWVMICHLLASGNRSRTMRGIKNKPVDLKSRVIFLAEVKNNQV